MAVTLTDVNQMISVEEARDVVLSHVDPLPSERVPLLDALGRVAASPCASDIDVAPFAHSAMDGFALRASQIAQASEGAPVQLAVIAEIGAGSVHDGPIGETECVRIMTGAELPEAVDSVVKYEVVDVVTGDGKPGSVVSFASPCQTGSNVRAAGEEAHAGDVVLEAGDVIGAAGMGCLASCGITEVDTFRRPKVAIMATGSELVPAAQVPGPGHIRESNSQAMAACVLEAGGVPLVMPIVPDAYDDLLHALTEAVKDADFVITTGGAANGDYDFIKQVVADAGEVYMTQVNMRPGKAQTFGKVGGTPVFGLPGNPAAAYCGFQMLIRPALRKMQGFQALSFPRIRARLTQDVKKKDPRRILLRSTYVKTADGAYEVTPAKNQSSGLFGVIQRSNCMAIMPEGLTPAQAGDEVECIVMGVPEETVL